MATPKQQSKQNGKGRSQQQPQPTAKPTIVATNRRAKRDFEILETLEAGLVLLGSEVKALRDSQVELAEAYAQIRRGEVWLLGMTVQPYSHSAATFAAEPTRPRKLLLHRREIERLSKKLEQQPLTIIVLSVYFSGKHAKAQIALAKRKKRHDKRQQIATRDAQRDIERESKPR